VAQLILRYRKGEEVRWISHLDLKRTLERALRRAELPLELTQGHNPHPKMSFGPPLPLGATGDVELFTVHLTEATDPGEVKDRLNRQLPPGLEVSEAWTLPAHRKKETFGEIDLAEYTIDIAGEIDPAEIDARVRELLASEELRVQRGGNRPEREVDLRPLIAILQVVSAEPGRVELRARLRTGSHGGARPQEIIELLGLSERDCLVRYHRTGLYESTKVQEEGASGVWRRWTRSRASARRSRAQ
jgi:radical SAM-linked protein